jgi:hypothetical protein
MEDFKVMDIEEVKRPLFIHLKSPYIKLRRNPLDL